MKEILESLPPLSRSARLSAHEESLPGPSILLALRRRTLNPGQQPTPQHTPKRDEGPTGRHPSPRLSTAERVVLWSLVLAYLVIGVVALL